MGSEEEADEREIMRQEWALEDSRRRKERKIQTRNARVQNTRAEALRQLSPYKNDLCVLLGYLQAKRWNQQNKKRNI